MSSTHKRLAAGAGAAVLIVLALTVYYGYDPERYRWFPKCAMLAATGYKCPGCGTQRFIYHLLHGDVYTALRYNYLTAIVILWASAIAVCHLLPQGRCTRKARACLTGRHVVYTYIVLYFAWWILRNILNL